MHDRLSSINLAIHMTSSSSSAFNDIDGSELEEGPFKNDVNCEGEMGELAKF